MKRLTWVALTLSVLAGCASSGMRHAELRSLLPTLREDEGRVYFMRQYYFGGAAVQPDIRLDGRVVGRSKPGGFFYVDAKAGAHEVSATTEARRALSFNLDPGETKYIRSFPTFGILVGRVNFELLSPYEGEKELAKEFYIGAASTGTPAEDGNGNRRSDEPTDKSPAWAKPTDSPSDSRYPKPHRSPGDIGDSFHPSSSPWVNDSGD